jgi:hypothetical protein
MGTTGLFAFVGSDPVIATQMMHGFDIAQQFHLYSTE